MSGIIAGVAATVVAAGITAYGSVKSGEATAAADKYNAQVASNNATIATQNANYAGAAGAAQVEQASLATRAKVGGIIANQAAGNIDVTSGSALDVRSSAKDLGELNALTIRSNAARTAYGYQTQTMNFNAQSALDASSAANAVSAGDIGAASSVIGGFGSAASSYANYMKAGGGSNLNSGGGGSSGGGSGGSSGGGN